jgi:putative hydrolase of the HAD superfamily
MDNLIKETFTRDALPVILFDADDTLWITEPLYDDSRQLARGAVEASGLDGQRWEDLQRVIDVKNVTIFGLDPVRFPTSCRQAYIELCSQLNITANEQVASEIYTYAQHVFRQAAALVPGAADVLSELQGDFRLILLTKGNVDVQQKRIEESGLRGFFDMVQIVHDKTAQVIARLLEEVHAVPSVCWMVGNSVASDINPALACGMKTIWVDAHVWEHEKREPVLESPNLIKISELTQVPQAIRANLIVDPVDLVRDVSSGKQASNNVDSHASNVRPKKNSRKRPCVKQSGRKKEASLHDGIGRKPLATKLNQWYLDESTNQAVSIKPGVIVPKGAIVVEQRRGHPAPNITQFHDIKLLPEGSCIIGEFGMSAPELDVQMIARFGRIAGLANIGVIKRRTLLDQIARSIDPSKALVETIKHLGGEHVLGVQANLINSPAYPEYEIDPSLLTRDTVIEAVKFGINAGNEKNMEFTIPLPDTLEPRASLTDSLAKLPGVVTSLSSEASGSKLVISCKKYSDTQRAKELLIAAGGMRVHIKTQKQAGSVAGKPNSLFTITANFSDTPVEIAAGRSGSKPKLVYSVIDGSISAHYEAHLYGNTIRTNPISCGPSGAAVEALIKELAKTDVHTSELLADLAIIHTEPSSILAHHVGPVTDLKAALVAIETLTAENILGQDVVDEIINSEKVLVTNSGKKVNINWRASEPILDVLALHPSDLQICDLPDTLKGPSGLAPTMIREARFVAKKGSNRPKVELREVAVSNLKLRRDAWLEKTDPVTALVQECIENFTAEATVAMFTSMRTPNINNADSRRPEDTAKSSARGSVGPYTCKNGELILLIKILAASTSTTPGDQVWAEWCVDKIESFREKRKSGTKENFFSVLGLRSEARKMTVDAAVKLANVRLKMTLGQSDIERISEQLRQGFDTALFNAFDRGRALALDKRI